MSDYSNDQGEDFVAELFTLDAGPEPTLWDHLKNVWAAIRGRDGA